MKEKSKAYLCPIIFGIVLIIVSFIIQIPGGALTTLSSLDGDKTNSYYIEDRYSAIDEYVGGDAYNYIIGSSLVAGKITGAIVAKSIFFVGGSICLCAGITLQLCSSRKKEGKDENSSAETTDSEVIDTIENSIPVLSNDKPSETENIEIADEISKE